MPESRTLTRDQEGPEMDAEHFDTIARALSATSSRRTALGVSLAGLLAAVGLTDAEARKKKPEAKKKGNGKGKGKNHKKHKKQQSPPQHQQSPPQQPPSPECTPQCAGKACGNDGCGGSCGTCSGGATCSGSGTCQCPTSLCSGICCGSGQTCIGNQCWADSEETSLITLLNNHRAANGRPALTLQSQLGAAAELHSQDQAAHTFSSHTGSDGSSPNQRMTRQGYAHSWWGENIYYGGGTASEAFTWWKNSSGHNANMLSTNFTQVGIGRAFSSASNYWYWTTIFGTPA